MSVDFFALVQGDNIATLGTGVHLDVVDIQIELVGAVEVTDGHITGLASVGAQVSGELIPVALVAVATDGFLGSRSVLGSQRPFLDGGEVATIGVARAAHSNAEVFSGITGILSASPEAEGTTEGHLRRYEVVVRIEDTVGVAVAL